MEVDVMGGRGQICLEDRRKRCVAEFDEITPVISRKIIHFFSQSLLRSHFFFFFLKDPAPPEISPLPQHAALPIKQVKTTPPADKNPRTGDQIPLLPPRLSFTASPLFSPPL